MGLNSEQKSAVFYNDGPLLIIAGAGTGKTTVITERIKHLISKKKVKPSQILALTFTEKAASEMESRIDEALPLGYTQMWVMTFHGFCDRVLREKAIHIGIDPQYRLMTTAESLHFLRKHIFDLGLDYFRPLGNPTKFLFALLSHFARLQDEDISPEEYISWAENLKDDPLDESVLQENKKWRELAAAYKKYFDLKIAESVFDFGDLISKTLLLFRTRPNVLKEYQSRFPFILVDEYQDTNYSQNQLTRMLSGEDQNITVVLDDDQSIYRFRGAAISNALQFRTNFPNTKVITLTKNYRSYQKILDTAHTLISHNNPDRLEVIEGIDKRLISQRKGLSHIEFLHTNTSYEEADRVVQEILSCLKDGYSYKDIAILVRANNHADPFVSALKQAGIPHAFLGPGKLFQQQEISNLISYLKVLRDVGDQQAWYQLLSMPIFKIDARDLSVMTSWMRTNSGTFLEAIENLADVGVSDDTTEKIKKVQEMILSDLQKKSTATAGSILYDFLQSTGILASILEESVSGAEAKSQNLATFFSKIKQYEVTQKDSHVESILEWIELQTDLGESPLAAETDMDEEDCVKILTIHSSKGLEFPVVFVVNLVSQRFPSMNRSEQIPIPESLIREVLPTGDFHLQEERRLCYVALTRARDRLYLTAARMYGDGKREKKVSPFVVEALGEVAPITAAIPNVFPAEKQVHMVAEEKQKSLSINYLSYSQIETFKYCPLHYKLRYLIKLPSPSSPAASFGNSFHAVMKDFYKNIESGGHASKALIDQLLIDNWITSGYSSKQHMQESFLKAKSFLYYFVDNWFDEKIKTIAVECPFTFKIGDLKVGGIVDRIDLQSSGIHIIDYKTGEKKMTQSEADKSLQLSIYALAASKIQEPPFGHNPPDIHLSLMYFDKPEIVTTHRTVNQLKDAESELLSWKREIEQSDFSCSGSYFCQDCEYKMFCKSKNED